MADYIKKRIKEKCEESEEYRKAYEEELASHMHNMEMKDSDGQFGSTIVIDPDFIQKAIDKLETHKQEPCQYEEIDPEVIEGLMFKNHLYTRSVKTPSERSEDLPLVGMRATLTIESFHKSAENL